MERMFDLADEIANPDADEDEWNRVYDFIAELHGKKGNKTFHDHRLLGSINSMGEEPQETAQNYCSNRPGVCISSSMSPRSKKDWVLIASFASDDRVKKSGEHFGWLWSTPTAL